jgi:hypothetical protein
MLQFRRSGLSVIKRSRTRRIRWNIILEKAPLGWWADVDDTWCRHPGSCFWGRDERSAELKAQQWVKKRLNDLI